VHNAFAVPRFLLSSKERHRLELQRCVRIDYRFLWIDLNGFAQAFAADGNPTETVVMAAQFLAPAESNCSPSGPVHCRWSFQRNVLTVDQSPARRRKRAQKPTAPVEIDDIHPEFAHGTSANLYPQV
jgi:hypothetical protein